MPRGGARNGTPGKAYPQRTDLGVAKLPAVAAPGQTYGVAGQQVQAQQQVPMGAQPVPAAPAAAGGAPPPSVTPGSLGPLNAPTNRPNEPVTAGAPVGAGPNSLALPTPNMNAQTGAAAIQAAAATGNPALTYLASVAGGRA